MINFQIIPGIVFTEENIQNSLHMNKDNEFSDIISETETDNTMDKDFEPDDSISTSSEEDQTSDIPDPKPFKKDLISHANEKISTYQRVVSYCLTKFFSKGINIGF